MRSEVTRARDAGTNLAFLSANTMYWRVRLEDRSTGPRGCWSATATARRIDPLGRPSRRTTARFRDAPAARPEQDLIGMMYECYPVDEATSWSRRAGGASAGRAPAWVTVPGLVGPEADRVYPDRTLPRPLQILAHTPYSCPRATTTAQSVYYTAESGAGVFTAGTLRWGCALVDRCDRPLGPVTRRFVGIVTGNLVTSFANGPVGAKHPARDNVADFDLPLVNTVTAS